MRDWESLEADVDLILGRHYTPGRSGREVDKVVIHYNAGNLTVEGCYSVWQTREASAHYQVEDNGRVGQLVWDRDTAWHAGDWDQNCRSIGIEHANRADGTVSEACLDAGAHLTAAICKAYCLGRPEWDVNVFPHNRFQSTSCPGQLYGSQKDTYIQRAQVWYDYMTGAGEAPAVDADAQAPSGPDAETGSDGDFHGGLYRCTVDGLRIRTAPSLSGAIVQSVTYDRGEEVTLDNWYTMADGWVWGRYTGASSGEYRYVAVGKATGKPEADDYLVKV